MTQEVHRQAIRELIARDKNHPCVVIWSIANEPESWTPESRAYFEPLVGGDAPARPHAPGRLRQLHGRDARPRRDLRSLRRPHAQPLPRLVRADRGPRRRRARARGRSCAPGCDKHDKPIIFTEYGADAVAGLHALPPGPWTEEYQADVLAMFHRVFDRFDAVVGEQIWNFADFATAPGIMRVDGNKKGVFTRERRPKAAAHMLRRRWRSARDRRRDAGEAPAGPVPRLRRRRGREQPHVPDGLGVPADLLHGRRGHLRGDGGHAAPRRPGLGRLHRPRSPAAASTRPRRAGASSAPTCCSARVPLLALLVAMFSIPGGLGDGGKLVWALVSYALFSLAYSFVNIPYGSLAAAMTQEPDARAKLSSARAVSASLTILADRRRRLAADRRARAICSAR